MTADLNLNSLRLITFTMAADLELSIDDCGCWRLDYHLRNIGTLNEKEGRLAPEDIRKIVDLVLKKGFFEMKDDECFSYPRELEISLGDRSHTVAFMPDNDLDGLIGELETIVGLTLVRPPA